MVELRRICIGFAGSVATAVGVCVGFGAVVGLSSKGNSGLVRNGARVLIRAGGLMVLLLFDGCGCCVLFLVSSNSMAVD